MPARLLAIVALSAGICTAAFLAANAARPGPLPLERVAAPLAPPPEVRIRWHAASGPMLLGELENLTSAPLEHVLIRGLTRKAVFQSGLYVGQTDEPVATWVWSTHLVPRDGNQPDTPTPIYTRIAPGQSMRFSLYGTTQATLHDLHVLDCPPNESRRELRYDAVLDPY